MLAKGIIPLFLDRQQCLDDGIIKKIASHDEAAQTLIFHMKTSP